MYLSQYKGGKEIHGVQHIAFAIVDSSYDSISTSPMNPNEAEICHIYSTMRVAGKLSRQNETIIFN